MAKKTKNGLSNVSLNKAVDPGPVTDAVADVPAPESKELQSFEVPAPRREEIKKLSAQAVELRKLLGIVELEYHRKRGAVFQKIDENENMYQEMLRSIALGMGVDLKADPKAWQFDSETMKFTRTDIKS